MRSICFILALILLISGTTLGCGIGVDKADTENVATGLFEAIKNKDFDTAITFYSEKFFEQSPKEEWLQDLKTINTKLGDLETYELTNWKVRYTKMVAGTAESGTYCELKYEVNYSKYPSTETLTLYKPSGGDKFKILAHNISSIGLLRE